MNVLKRAAMWSANRLMAMAGSSMTLTDKRLYEWAGSGNIAGTGHAVDEHSAMRVTTAFACIRVLAETAGTVTLKVYEKQKNGNAEEVDHPISELLAVRPNPEQTGMEFREVLTSNLAARGNCYAFREDWNSGEAANLLPIPASRCEPKRKPDGLLVYAVTDETGRTREYPAEKIWHVRGFGFDGFKGLSPIGCARDALGLAMAGEEANSRLFKNGLAASAIVSIDSFLKKEQREIAKEKLQDLWSGLQNYGKPVLLEGGMKVEDGMFSPEDAQFLQLRQMQIPELCRIWRISPHMIADLQRATNNNIEQLSLEFIMYTMAPYFRRYEERMRELFKPADRGRFYVRFNYESLLRGDSESRGALYSIMLQNGVFSRNEVRVLENKNRIDGKGMDDYTVQTNMAPIGDLSQIALQRNGKQPAANA